MNLLSHLRRKPTQPDAVVLSIPGRHLDNRLRPSAELADLLDALVTELESSGEGDFDIMERASDSTILFFSGRRGDVVLQHLRPVLRGFAFCNGATLQVHTATGEEQQHTVEYNTYA